MHSQIHPYFFPPLSGAAGSPYSILRRILPSGLWLGCGFYKSFLSFITMATFLLVPPSQPKTVLKHKTKALHSFHFPLHLSPSILPLLGRPPQQCTLLSVIFHVFSNLLTTMCLLPRVYHWNYSGKCYQRPSWKIQWTLIWSQYRSYCSWLHLHY